MADVRLRIVPLPAGSSLGPYEVVSPLGAGGMGEVYKARDTRLGRTVAIKVLPPHVSADPEARQRFEREAQTIASLSHPHICVLHDVGRERPRSSDVNDRAASGEPIDFLVMEYLQGTTLAERLAAGPMPVSEAVGAALQVAAALDEAHRSGVVHRDLKPANVFLVGGTTAKLLDFGLAKPGGVLRSAAAASIEVTAAGRATTGSITAEGTIVGTFQYMAPEQIEGRDIDARADIFAFGAMLYEMLTGRPAFQGGSQASIMAAILAGPRPSLSLSERIAPHLDHIIRGCLEKDPANRWQSIRDVALELRSTTDAHDPLTIALTSAHAPAAPRRAGRFWLMAIPVAAAMVALGAGVMYARRPAANAPTIRFEVPVAGSSFFVSISPDGRMLAYNAPDGDGPPALWVRPVDSLEARIVPGTTGNPDWSPDGRFLVFNGSDRTLKRIDLRGGQAQTIAPLSQAGYQRATWSTGGVVVFSNGGRLFRVPASGGDPVVISAPDATLGETSHATPWFLPDGRRFLYTAWANEADKRAVYVGTIDVEGSTDEERLERAKAARVRLVAGESKAIYVEPGYLLYLQNRALMARPFDAERLAFTGEAHRIADNVLYNPQSGAAAFGASSGGTIVYRRGGAAASADANREWAWFDRSGQRSARVGSPHGDTNVALSHDGTRLAFVVGGQTAGDVWVEDLTRGLRTRLTSRADSEMFPVWSPDDTRLAFVTLKAAATRQGQGDVHVMPANGAVPDTMLVAAEPQVSLLTGAWSADGRTIVAARLVQDPASTSASSSAANLWVVPADGGKPTPYLSSAFVNVQPALSPDGRWLAYTTNESGNWQVVVQPFPDPAGGKVQVSTAGGMAPRWRPDGRELFYLTPNRELTAVPVTTGERFDVGAPATLFAAPMPNVEIVGVPYAVSPDGKRFLFSLPVESQVQNTPIAVVTNWASALKD